MNFFDNDYALPVFLGADKNAILAADTIRRNTDLKIHFFSRKIPFFYKLIYKYHKIALQNDDMLLLALNDFADDMSDYYTPILIFSDDIGKAFTDKYSHELEQRYIIISSKTVQNCFLKGS